MASKGIWQSMTRWMGNDDGQANGPESNRTEAASPAGEQTEQPGESLPVLRSADDRHSQPRRDDSHSGATPPATPDHLSQPPGPRPVGGAEGPNQETRGKVIEAIKSCYDPEIPVNIYELGLIYEVIVDPADQARVKMTLTAPNCPAAQSLPAEVKYKIEALEEINSAGVEIVFDPPWTPNQMSDAAKLTLNIL